MLLLLVMLTSLQGKGFINGENSNELDEMSSWRN